jgi:hypothetical protein
MGHHGYFAASACGIMDIVMLNACDFMGSMLLHSCEIKGCVLLHACHIMSTVPVYAFDFISIRFILYFILSLFCTVYYCKVHPLKSYNH